MSDTLAQRVEHAVEVRRSRFLARAAPVEDIDAAMAFLAEASAAEATHHCWAYRVGDRYRFADDGEPAGTAGKPILAAIDGQGFDRVMVVVTRWFGGVKLGAGGLVRAYGGCAAECLRSAPRAALVAYAELLIHAGFEHEAVLRLAIADAGGDVADPVYGSDGLQLPARVPAQRVAALERRIADLTRGGARIHAG